MLYTKQQQEHVQKMAMHLYASARACVHLCAWFVYGSFCVTGCVYQTVSVFSTVWPMQVN